MGYVTSGASTPGTSTAAAVVGPLPAAGGAGGLAAGQRIFAVVSSGASNPNVLTDPTTGPWVKLDEWAPDGTFKSAAYYIDVTAANLAALAGSSHTWNFATAARTTSAWTIYDAVDQTKPPLYAKVSGAGGSAGATNVPSVTPGAQDWEIFIACGRQSPGTDTAKSWSIAGYSSDVKRQDLYATNTGTGQKLSTAVFDTNGPASASGGGSGGASSVVVTDANPVNQFNSYSLNSGTLRIGATMDSGSLDNWKPRLLKTGWMRIFPNSDKMPPDWGDSRYLYCQSVGAHPFISTKIDGDTTKIQGIYDYFMNMPSWILNDPNFMVWYIEHHEPEKEYVAAAGSVAAGGTKFISDFTAVWNKIQTLPANIRAKIKMGAALTKQWTESASKGNYNYATFDPGIGDFLGIDAYHDSNSGSNGITTYIAPATFLQYIKAYTPKNGCPVVFPELGVINALGDDDGSGRAAWFQGVFDQVKTWTNFGGFCVWNSNGTPSTSSVTGIGTARYFQLDTRYAAENTPADLPKVTTSITYGGSSGTARSITPNQTQANIHVWSITVPMPAPVVPVAGNVWSTMGLPVK